MQPLKQQQQTLKANPDNPDKPQTPGEEETLIQQQIKPQKVQQQPQQKQKDKDKDKPPSKQEEDRSVNRSQSEDSLMKNKVDLGDSVVGDELHDKKDEQQQESLIADDYFYPDDHQEKEHDDSPIPAAVTKLDGFFGHDSFKRYNVHALDRDTIIYASGISYTIYNHFTKESKMFLSKDKGGIGSIAVSPSKKYFAVGQLGVLPNIYIYEYPSMKLHRILRKGTEKSYSCVTFSSSGNLLASVGAEPDFLLTVWEWKKEKLMLKSKAFSQDIYRVTFSQFNENWLSTSGTGHIRFWKIAETFTGLKLQGDIAKFGQFQLSDVTSYAQFEDGNVLSSSQYGKLLLWEGNLVKSVVAIDEKTPCHNGPIEFVKLQGKKIITAGADGYIRFWDYVGINMGESDEQFNLYVKPQKQIYFESAMKTPAYILWIQILDDYWLVHDALGAIYKFQPQTDKREVILQFSAGRFNEFATSPLINCCVTAGYDGYVRLWDYGNKREYYNRKFKTPAESTCVDWLPFSKRNMGRMIVVGFSDGLVRFLGLGEKGFTLIKAFKAHRNKVIKVKVSREGNIVVAADSSGALFFFEIDVFNLDKITPFCLFETGFKINDLSWDKLGEKILLACQDGKLHEITTPKFKECDFSESYLKDFAFRSYTIKMMQSQKPNKQDLQLQLLLKKTKGGNVDDVVVDQQWDPAPIMNATYYDPDCSKILCSVQGNYLGFYYIVDFKKERPIGGITASKKKTSYLRHSDTNDLIFIGFKNGAWELRHKVNPEMYLKKMCFDQNYGIVRKVGINTENTAIISVSEDGTMLTHKFDFGSFLKGAKGDMVEEVQISIPNVILGISEPTFSDRVDFGKDIEKDLTDNSVYSLQDEKLKAEQDTKQTEAEKIKNKKLKKIKELQSMFRDIIQNNNKETDYLARLSTEELIVDPEYTEAFQKRIDEEEEETRKELMWDEHFADLGRKKLQKYFLDELEYNFFKVKGIKTDTVVSSFKLKKMTPYIQQELEKIEKIISEQEKPMTEKRDTTSQFAQSKALMEMNKLRDTRKSKEDNMEVRNKIKQAEVEFEKELSEAVATKGDYKLKCAHDYEVPENQRLNMSRKKKQLFLHYQYLFLEKKEFNAKLKELKDRKRKMVQSLDGINSRLRQINEFLEIQEKDIFFEIDEEIESLEYEIQVNEQEIAEHLVQKQKEKEANKKSTGMSMGGGGGQATEEKKVERKTQKKTTKKIAQEKKEEKAPQIKTRPNIKKVVSALEVECKKIMKIKYEAEKKKILESINQNISNFDEQLKELKSLKYRLESDLNMVEMKILTYSQQFIVFRDMQVYDNKVMESLVTLGSDQTNFQNNFIQLSTEISDLESLNEQIKKKCENEKKILKEFVYPDDDDMRERIIKYYKIRERKRINKLKKQAQMEEREKKSNSDDSDEEEEEESEEEDSDQEFDEDQKPDITVIENDHKNFERVRKICEYEEKIEENSKKKSDLEKQRHQVTTKIKNITQELIKVQKQLKFYQKKKLIKANQLNVSFPVKFSQLQHILNVNNKSRLHEDLNSSILFTLDAFNRLTERIQELKKEKVDIEKKQKNLNKKLTKLTEEVSKASSEIQNKRKQYEEKQLLKFGSTFEMDRLKELEPTPQVLEMRDMYKKEEREVSKKIEQIKQQLQQRKRQLLESRRQNTKVITEITELGDRQNDLKKKLDSTNKQLFKNYDVSKKDELDKERQNLKDLIKFLSKEIEDLKTQIGLFKRKGGHIYTMVTSNKKNFS